MASIRVTVEAAADAVVEAARCIRHWHDRVYSDGAEGMVVSADHVRSLWEALSRYDAAVAEGSSATPAADPSRCLTCHWWGLRDSASIPEANRQCRRFPPIATRDADGEMVSEWPWTNQNDYCGEHAESRTARLPSSATLLGNRT